MRTVSGATGAPDIVTGGPEGGGGGGCGAAIGTRADGVANNRQFYHI